jgi:hypothetical protein
MTLNFSHWKTTANGILGFFIATGAVLTAVPSSFINPKISAGLTVSLALARAWVGILQQDAGTTTAIVPGSGVQPVPSHEIPDDENIKEIVK